MKIENRSPWIDELKQYPDMKTLRWSAFYREHRAQLRQILNTTELRLAESAEPLIREFVRVASWNIEKGKNFKGLVEAFSSHPILRYADLVLLNEVDVGMNRSENRHVARELAQALNMHYVFAPAYLELTKGIDRERDLPGENKVGLQGNAILSRHPLRNPRVIDLPACWEHFDSEEKRYGRRIALLSDALIDTVRLVVVCTHLEVRNTPTCRAKQMTTIMKSLGKENKDPILIGGDFNSNTFVRGNRWRTLTGCLRILFSPPDRLRKRLLHPSTSGEPLFGVLARHGFSFLEFNDAQATSSASLNGIEDALHLPEFLQKAALARLARYDYQLELKLDWIAARGIRALSDGEMCDASSKVFSVSPQTIKRLTFQDRPISDHDPVVVDVQRAKG